jgi:beta-glucosidase
MDALLVVWHPGTAGGDALADLLSGDYSPSGHLTMSFPRCDGQIPIRYNYKSTGRPLTKEMDYTQSHKAKKNYQSCYLFTPNTPLYPFGYGLSYTTFNYSGAKLSSDKIRNGKSVTLKVKVSNTGEIAGHESVQVYVKRLNDDKAPVKALKGLKMIYLEPGETRTVSIELPASSFEYYDGYCDECGREVRVGDHYDFECGEVVCADCITELEELDDALTQPETTLDEVTPDETAPEETEPTEPEQLTIDDIVPETEVVTGPTIASDVLA